MQRGELRRINLSLYRAILGSYPPGLNRRGDSPMGKMDGMVADVTGGASGIGEATVRSFIAEGAQVAFADRDGERGQRVAAELAASGGHVVFVETHVEQEAEVAAFIQSAVDHFGQLNILVNN